MSHPAISKRSDNGTSVLHGTTIELMRSKLPLLCLAAAMAVSGQTPGDREFRRAQSNIEEFREQREAGVAPRAKLDQAEEALSGGQDAWLLSRTCYGED